MKKYFTEEERKAAQREANKRWREKNKDKITEYQIEYYKKNKNKLIEYQKLYRQYNKEKIAEYCQKNKEKRAEYHSEWYQNNKEREVVRSAEYYQNNREQILERQTKYRLTPFRRACDLNNSYKHNDKKYNRGECTLTPQWIIDNIFTQPCHYCGETDWRKIGCDRIDNTLPHTQDNVIPCCSKCNRKRGRNTYDEFMKMMGKVT